MASQNAKKTSASEASSDLGQAEVQAKFDEANERGYFGTVPDETPNENYTLKGVIAGKPTPENQRGAK